MAHLPQAQSTTRQNVPRSEQNLNLVIFGIQESKKGTPRHIRIDEHLKAVTATLEKLDSNIDDCHRLGKYSEQAHSPCPILAKFNRAIDVSRVLSKWSVLPPVIIKCDMTREECKLEAILLKQRWLLIQSGTSKKAITK